MIIDFRKNKCCENCSSNSGGGGGGGFSGIYDDLKDKPTIPNITYSYFCIWAEEKAGMNAGHFEWSYGDGSNTRPGCGVVVPFDCELIAVSLCTYGSVSCSVEVVRNNEMTGKRISKINTKRGFNEFEDSPVKFYAGDAVNFKTIKVSRGSRASVVTAWFRKSVKL